MLRHQHEPCRGFHPLEQPRYPYSFHWDGQFQWLGNTAAAITGATLSGVVGTEDVTLANASSGTFADNNIGIGKAVATSPMTLAGADAGNYPLTQPTLTGNITAATLTITGPTKSREYGEPNPNLDGTYSGEQNGETFTVTGNTSATQFSPPGEYDIVPVVTGATLANYNVTLVNGKLTVIGSSFDITSITLSNGLVTITWNSLVGSTYRLQFTDSLTAAAWTDQLPDLTATSSTTSVTNVLESVPQRLFRVRLLP